MSEHIVIIGSGFAAYQLVKAIRRTDKQQPITVITAGDGHDYNKPDISHVFTKSQTSADLITTKASTFAAEHNITLLTNQAVESIDSEKQTVSCGEKEIGYSKLVLATGASAFTPPIQGDATDKIITLNSRGEYAHAEQSLQTAKKVLVIGGGLIGTELAMDIASSGKAVTIVDPCQTVIATMLPDFVALPLQQKLVNTGVALELNNTVVSLDQGQDTLRATLQSGRQLDVDCVVSAAGLKPNIELAKRAGIKVERGIVVDRQLRTSVPNIFALGDCAQIEGKVMAFLQPILLSANALAKTLQGVLAPLKLTPMLVKVKTPLLPIQLSGQTLDGVDSWQVDIDGQGLTAKAYDSDKKLIGFVVTQERMKDAFPLLRELPPIL